MSTPAFRTSAPKSGRVLAEVWQGAKIAWRGLRMWSTSRRLMAWGLLPGAITIWVFAGAAILIASQLVTWSGAIASALVSSDGLLHTLLHIVVGAAIVVGAVVLGIYTFAFVTLTVGQPFFERISRDVDDRLGYAGQESTEAWYRSAIRGLVELLRIAMLTVPLALGLFILGLVPVVGGIASFILGAAFGGWFLALELTTYPFERRGVIRLSERRAVLRRSRAKTVGFGATVFLIFLIPLGPALFMPAAVAGATRLVHDSAGRAAQSA